MIGIIVASAISGAIDRGVNRICDDDGAIMIRKIGGAARRRVVDVEEPDV